TLPDYGLFPNVKGQGQPKGLTWGVFLRGTDPGACHSERSEESARGKRFFAALRMTGTWGFGKNLPVQGPLRSPSRLYLYCIFNLHNRVPILYIVPCKLSKGAPNANVPGELSRFASCKRTRPLALTYDPLSLVVKLPWLNEMLSHA